MSSRALISLRQTPNFICAQCVFVLRRNVSLQPRLHFHSSPALGERQVRGIPRILPSKLRNPLSKAPTAPPELTPEPFQEDEEVRRSPEEEQALEEMKAGANVR